MSANLPQKGVFEVEKKSKYVLYFMNTAQNSDLVIEELVESG